MLPIDSQMWAEHPPGGVEGTGQIDPDIGGQGFDFLIFDTPGRDDTFARHVATSADTLVTPLNDSFVDFDLIGQVASEEHDPAIAGDALRLEPGAQAGARELDRSGGRC